MLLELLGACGCRGHVLCDMIVLPSLLVAVLADGCEYLGEDRQVLHQLAVRKLAVVRIRRVPGFRETHRS